MNKKASRELILNMVNFYSLFNTEFIELIPDLTNAEITPLLSKILNFINFEGITTASKISKKLNISVPNTSRSINTLYNLGYLIKKQDEKDKRIVYLSLSNKALKLILSISANGEDDFLEKFKVLSNDEMEEFTKALLKAQNLIIKMRDLNEEKKNMKKY
jgi:DNA-binding MarR family transcriptional regulator